MEESQEMDYALNPLDYQRQSKNCSHKDSTKIYRRSKEDGTGDYPKRTKGGNQGRRNRESDCYKCSGNGKRYGIKRLGSCMLDAAVEDLM